MTSNVGAHQIQRSTGGIGFRVTEDEEADYQDMKRMVTDELRKTFRPEFLNRIDETMVFHALSKEHITEIVDIMLKDLRQQLQERGLTIAVSDPAKEVLVEKGFDPDFGARPLRRAIQRLMENPLSEEILKGTFGEGDKIMVSAEDGKLVFLKQEEVATV
jgi:ATP-dependent Clp protease ATP-binding subunit ClpC